MKSYEQQYHAKLTRPDRAMEHVTSGDTVMYGMSIAQRRPSSLPLPPGPGGAT